jgi:hypothetical protein
MSTRTSDDLDWENHPTTDGPLPEVVDWILGALIALSGVLSLVSASALLFLVDQDFLAEAIEAENVTVTVGTSDLTETEAIEVADAITSWVGLGMLVAGLGLVLFAIGYVIVRHRAHRRYERGGPISSYTTHAVLGAVATAVLSFLPFSPVLGGGLAGYLERGESDRTVSAGTFAGFLPVLPFVVILLFLLVGLVSGLRTVDQTGAAVVAGAAIFFGMMFAATVGAVLGALGGYLGGKFAEDRATN